MDLAALASEITADPAARGYAAHVAAGQDNAIADLLNARLGSVTVYEAVESHRVAACVTRAAWAALAAIDRSWLQFLVSAPFVDATSATLRQELDAVFPAGNPTTAPVRLALLALARRDGSRAEALFGAGAVVDPSLVARALGRG